MGLEVAGEKKQLIVALDAVIVVTGAVLTAFVRVVGLVRRLASDRVVLDSCEQGTWNEPLYIAGHLVVAASLVQISMTRRHWRAYSCTPY
ncbi:hypothetical protein GN244_ATG00765 [Phytophthora infestans]|uniref:Transmembrane protein n=1 Tax=Phytophthora infestans TaxID=4787 RepID=A0A833TPH6_PHYIN|nr:hypothetical protein GN244_ATG00765 [Phytophthora infestans]KAF4130451.1 hypothetical protein GN958_ATG20345 [Phytophthora infestans]